MNTDTKELTNERLEDVAEDLRHLDLLEFRGLHLVDEPEVVRVRPLRLLAHPRLELLHVALPLVHVVGDTRLTVKIKHVKILTQKILRKIHTTRLV